MKFQPEHSSAQSITGYGPGWISVGAEKISHSLILGSSGLRLGISTHGYAEMLRADALSPSYIALGAVFPTTLKRMATAPQGLARLNAYARLMQGTPLVAIGGIDTPRLADVLVSGVGSVAVVRALIGADNPEAEAGRWIAQIQQHLQPLQEQGKP